MKILKVFYSEGYADSYTVVYDEYYPEHGTNLSVSMNHQPTFPSGICMHEEVDLNYLIESDNFVEIKFDDLPEECQNFVLGELNS